MSRRIWLEIAFRSPFRDSIAAISLSPAMTEASGRAFVRARSAYARRRVVLCRPWILCNETAISNGARSGVPLNKISRAVEKKARAPRRDTVEGTAARSISISLYWLLLLLLLLLHNGYTRATVHGRSRGCIKARLIFPADRCSNLLRALDRCPRLSRLLFLPLAVRRCSLMFIETALSSPVLLTLSIRPFYFVLWGESKGK